MAITQNNKLRNVCSVIPQRYVLALMGFLSTIIILMLRQSLELTMVWMVEKSLTIEDIRVDNSLENYTKDANATETNLFQWDIPTQSKVLGAFLNGYIMTQFFGGMLSEFFGGKIILGTSVLSASICTCLFPIILSIAGDSELYYLRLITGMASGLSLPAIMVLISRWVPKDEQARISAIMYGGTYIGYIITPFLIQSILAVGEWSLVFYLFGCIGAIWFIVWYFVCYSTPNDHPFITECEKNYLNQTVVTLIRSSKYPMDGLPWKAFLRCGPFWITVLAFIAHELAFQAVVTYLPAFILYNYGYNIAPATTMYTVGFLVMWIASIIFAVICDCSISKKICSVVNARRIYTIISVLGPVICVSIAIYSGNHVTLAVFMYVVAMLVLGAYHSGAWINFLDIIPNYSGTMIGIADNIAINSARIISMVFSVIAPSVSFMQVRYIYLIFIVVMVLLIVIYAVYAKSEQVWWDDVRLHGYPSDWKHGYLTTMTNIILDEEKNSNTSRCQRHREGD